MTDWDDAERPTLDPLERELAALRERHRGDPPFDHLRAARAGALPDDMPEKIVAHLESSAWSRALVEGADDAEGPLDTAMADRLLSRIQRTARSTTGPRLKTRRRWAPVLVFGSVAAVVVIGVFLWRRPAPMQGPTIPAAQTAPQSASPAFALQLTRPDVKLTPAALLVRGEGGGKFVDDIAPGLNAYRAGEYATAARELEAVQPKYPRSVEIPFYLGVSRLFLNDPSAAARALETARALNDPSFDDDVAWYLAVAYDRAGSRVQSRPLFERLCIGKGAHVADACAATGNRR